MAALLALPASGSAQTGSGAVSGSYRLKGDEQIQPSLLWDDGRRTYMDWPSNTELPAVFTIDARGVETSANGNFRGGRFVLDSVHARLIFRLDRQEARADRTIARMK